MLSMSPIRYELYLLKEPPNDSSASPSASAIDANTLMIVSAPYVVLSLTKFSSTENSTANTIIDRLMSMNPNTTPTAMPQSAECPIASEKNAIFLFTIIVPISANIGADIRMASNAFFMNVNEMKSNGSSTSIM